ncbi:MAG: TRAP transporter substrate-binding protein [Acetobacteraceae bacterium]
MQIRTFVATAVSLAWFGAAWAADLPKANYKAVGPSSNTVAWTVDDQAFWFKQVPEASKGAITVDATPFDQMGIDDKTVLRLLKLGVMDFAAMDISKMAGDDPRFEGCDLAGLALDVKTARAACDAWRKVMDERMQKNWGSKLLAIGGNPPQVFWCKSMVAGLDDLKGRKIRVFNNSMRDFMSGVGASSISMSFQEVVPALNNGVVDCAVTGTLSGNTAGWPEVTKTIYPISLGWSINVKAVNLGTWNKMPAETKAFFTEQFRMLEDKMWETIRAATEQADNCNFGRQPCTMGKPAHLTLSPLSDADKERYKAMVEGSVLRNWAKRCGAECAKAWNETVGRALGLQAAGS